MSLHSGALSVKKSRLVPVGNEAVKGKLFHVEQMGLHALWHFDAEEPHA